MAKTYATPAAARASKAYRERKEAGQTDSHILSELVKPAAPSETVPASGVSYETAASGGSPEVDSQLSNDGDTTEEE